MSALAVAAKRSLVHRIKKMLKPVARLVSRSTSSSAGRQRVPPPCEADLDNLANEALEEKLMLAENAANEERVRVLLLLRAHPAAASPTTETVAVACACCSRAGADADLWPAAATLSRCQRAEQQRPF